MEEWNRVVRRWLLIGGYLISGQTGVRFNSNRNVVLYKHVYSDCNEGREYEVFNGLSGMCEAVSDMAIEIRWSLARELRLMWGV